MKTLACALAALLLTTVSFADQMVSQSQGSGGVMDVSSMQAGAEAYKQWVMFFSYQNTVYQQLRNSFLRARDRGEYMQAIGTAAFWLTIPAVYAQTVRMLLTNHAELPEEPEDVPWWLVGATLNEAFGTVPYVRDLAPIFTQALGYGKYFASRTPFQRFGEDLQRAASKEDEDFFLEMSLFGLGWGLGTPVAGPTDLYETIVED